MAHHPPGHTAARGPCSRPDRGVGTHGAAGISARSRHGRPRSCRAAVDRRPGLGLSGRHGGHGLRAPDAGGPHAGSHPLRMPVDPAGERLHRLLPCRRRGTIQLDAEHRHRQGRLPHARPPHHPARTGAHSALPLARRAAAGRRGDPAMVEPAGLCAGQLSARRARIPGRRPCPAPGRRPPRISNAAGPQGRGVRNLRPCQQF